MSNERVFDNLTKDFWAINFDLDTKEVEKLHPSHILSNAYEELKKFFKDNGFVHRQGSGYVSKEAFTSGYMRMLAFTLNRTYPYAKDYIKRMDATIIKPEYIFDFKEYFDNKDSEQTVKYTGELENFIPQPKVERRPEEIAHDLKLVLMESEEDEKRQNELLDNATVHTQEAVVITPTTEVANNEEKVKIAKKEAYEIVKTTKIDNLDVV